MPGEGSGPQQAPGCDALPGLGTLLAPPEEGDSHSRSQVLPWPQPREKGNSTQARVWDQEGRSLHSGQGRGRTHLLPSSSSSWEPPWSTLSRPAGPRGSTECPNPHCGRTEGQLCTKGCCAVDGRRAMGKCKHKCRCSHVHSAGFVPTCACTHTRTHVHTGFETLKQAQTSNVTSGNLCLKTNCSSAKPKCLSAKMFISTLKKSEG